MKLNYYALLICVVTKKTPEEALRAMRILPQPVKAKNTDVDEILRLKKSLTWKQVAEIYGVSDHAIQKRVTRSQKH